MKQYDVKISRAALSDMEQIYSYIADRLLEPDTAMGQYNRIAEAIQSLNILPERCALVGKRTRAHPRAAADAGGQLLGVLHRGRGCRVSGSCAVQCIRPCAPPAENEVKGVFA